MLRYIFFYKNQLQPVVTTKKTVEDQLPTVSVWLHPKIAKQPDRTGLLNSKYTGRPSIAPFQASGLGTGYVRRCSVDHGRWRVDCMSAIIVGHGLKERNDNGNIVGIVCQRCFNRFTHSFGCLNSISPKFRHWPNLRDSESSPQCELHPRCCLYHTSQR